MEKTIVTILCVLMLISCCPCKKLSSSEVRIERDSVYITHHDTLRIVERDTMWLDRLEQYHDKILTTAQHSELGNVYCTSSAGVNEDGLLYHRLDTRDSALLPSHIVYRDRVVRDTIYRWRNRDNTRTEVVEKRVKTVPWWVKPLCVVSAALAAIVIWQNRKRIMSMIRLWRI